MTLRFHSTGPATSQSGGSSLVSFTNKPPTFIPPDDDENLKLSPVRFWRPNQEPDTLLKCGCSIPWPIITLLGSGGKVECSEHGPQHVAEKEKARARKAMKKCQNTVPSNQSSLLLDTPPF